MILQGNTAQDILQENIYQNYYECIFFFWWTETLTIEQS